MKKQNDYARAFGPLYDQTPKAVFAAVAWSQASGGGDRPEAAPAAFLAEWETLHGDAIIPQAPPPLPCQFGPLGCKAYGCKCWRRP